MARWTWLLSWAVLAGLALAAVAPAYINHDAAWYLFVVDRWFSGATLYRDIVDTNPPLIIWLSAPPVWIARHIGVEVPQVFKAYIFSIAVLSLAAAWRIIRRAWPSQTFVLVTMLVYLCLPFVEGDFGQREHLAVLLVLPYVFRAAGAADGTASRGGWLAGVAGGLGFALKPHLLIAWVAVEIAVVSSRGGRVLTRPQVVAAALTCLAYALLAGVMTPQYFEVADRIRHVYGGLDSDPGVFIRLRELQWWIAAAAVFASVRWPPPAGLPRVLFAAGSGFLLAALLQFKGWGYHLYPARVFLLLFFAAAAAAFIDAAPALTAMMRGGRRGLAVVLACALAIASVRPVVEARRTDADPLVTSLISTITRTAPGARVALLSTRSIVYPAFPAVNYAHAAWSIRHNGLWFLPEFYASQNTRPGGPLLPHALDSMPALERIYFDEIVSDLRAAPPDVLVLEEPPAQALAGGRALDLMTYYSQDPQAAQLLSSYHETSRVGVFVVYAHAGMGAR